MSHALLRDARLYVALLKFDRDLASQARVAGCARCGGVLHAADYPRKPRGGPEQLPPGYDRRLSLCCRDCRRRTTPQSLRFLGRRVYLGAVFVLVCAMRHGLSARRVAELRRQVGVSRRTLERWRRWWLTTFVSAPVWKAVRGRMAAPVATSELPKSLLERFEGTLRDQLEAALRLLQPLSIGGHLTGRGR